MSAKEVVELEVESHERHAGPPGFLTVERYHLRNRRADGSRSAPYVCDFLGRPKGPDAVVLALYHRDAAGTVSVLLRRGLRPALWLGRPPESLAVSEARRIALTEVVAGIVETDDVGKDGLRFRAAREAFEEAGIRIDANAVEFLGAATFPSPGSMPEKFWLMSAEVLDPDARVEPPTDGSPMEEGARCWWMPLEEAIAACVAGDIEDCKTELVLRRLRERLKTREE